MRWPSLALALLTGVAIAQDEITTTPEAGLTASSYQTYSSTITDPPSATPSDNQTAVTTSDSLTVLVGGDDPTYGNGTMANATVSSSPAASQAPVVNTQPCNGYPEFCARKYSNITMVAAHNSPFVRTGNVASNQALDVTTQLDDGIRMLQFQTHYRNGTMMLCHTSCEMLNVGTLEAYLTQVNAWMRKHPYDVVTILMGNFDLVSPGNFTDPIEKSGLQSLIYTPPQIPMGLNDWPMLSEMILTGKRAVFFLDYGTDQIAYPWLMDEFSQMWETPFSPTDPAFPCTQQRPPHLSKQDAKNRLYMANHNLNLQLNLGTVSLLIPNLAQIEQTNGVGGFGSLGRAAENCTDAWGRPPNFLLVDYYNMGRPQNGSVFEVAAEMNNVTYDWSRCCGMQSAATTGMSVASVSTVLLAAAGVQFLLSIF